MWTRDNSGTKDVWALERELDADGAWLKDTYGLDFAEREFVRNTVERGEEMPHENLREPAAEYAERVLRRSWWVRHGTARLSGLALLVVVSGLFVMEVVSLTLGASADWEPLVIRGAFLLVTATWVINLQWVRSRRLRRAIRLNRAGGS
jgi:hypothetical protein